MTLSRFVRKNAFRNKRRSILTILSVGFSLLLLTFMISIWRSFYIDQGSVQSAQRLMVRHKVSLVFSLPAFYREKIQKLVGHVVLIFLEASDEVLARRYSESRRPHPMAQTGASVADRR